MHDRERSRTAWAVLTQVRTIVIRSKSPSCRIIAEESLASARHSSVTAQRTYVCTYLLYLSTRVVYYQGGIPSVRSPQLGCRAAYVHGSQRGV